MDKLASLGTGIQETATQTVTLYTPLLLRNADYIRATKKETFAYGPHERHQLDVYHAPKPSIKHGRKPVLIFIYGGGFIHGAKTLPTANGLCHANIATFFANNYGYTVVVPDYRLVSHGGRFPSGGEELALATEWILQNGLGGAAGPDEALDLYMLGNSAGGVNVLTLLLHESCDATRKKLLTGTGTRLRGAIALAPPLHFHQHASFRDGMLDAYFPDHRANCPFGLLQAIKASAPFDWVKAGVRLLLLDAEWDPVDEIRKPKDDFVREWLSLGDNASRSALAVDTVMGMNHVSPFVSLGTGIEREEVWGHQAAAFMENIRRIEVK
ncbi:alpha/beta hydrolase fold [Teratosphaeria destructans]|uniref:Alpha/beta hydrolase fold n=1 Tax=Teratosphaeria destructans TaxID=418781 RepID=A0A9W7VYM5_9PEZI|nr:alpha/beta hydrolase fold [Teratosphaeria destructans]